MPTLSVERGTGGKWVTSSRSGALLARAVELTPPGVPPLFVLASQFWPVVLGSAVFSQAVAALPPAGPSDYARLVGLHDRVDAALRASGRVELADGEGNAVTVVGEPACASRFELLSSGSKAAADGKRVVIGRKLVEALPPDPLKGDE